MILTIISDRFCESELIVYNYLASFEIYQLFFSPLWMKEHLLYIVIIFDKDDQVYIQRLSTDGGELGDEDPKAKLRRALHSCNYQHRSGIKFEFYVKKIEEDEFRNP